MSLAFLQGLQQVAALAPLALGVWIAFFLLRFPDFTFQGSFVLGGAVFGVLVEAGGGGVSSALFALLAAAVAGGASGAATALVNSRLGVPSLLSGIGVAFGCYSISLIVMSGPTVSIEASRSLLGPFLKEQAAGGLRRAELSGYLHTGAMRELALLLFVSGSVFLACRLFLTSRSGLLLRASGLNPAACRTYGFSSEGWQVLGLASSNLCCAVSGALFAQNLRFADVGFGGGVVALALGVAILSEGLSRQAGWSPRLVALFGALVVFQAIRMAVLRLPVGSDYLRLAEGVMLLAVIAATARLRRGHPLWDLRL